MTTTTTATTNYPIQLQLEYYKFFFSFVVYMHYIFSIYAADEALYEFFFSLGKNHC